MRDARTARRQQPGGSGERETFSDELSAILIEQGAFSLSFAWFRPGILTEKVSYTP